MGFVRLPKPSSKTLSQGATRGPAKPRGPWVTKRRAPLGAGEAPRLLLGDSGSSLEKQAERAAMRGEQVQAPSSSGGQPLPELLASSIQQERRWGGAPLAQSTRRDIGGKPEVDVARVRVHTGKRASELSEALNARAFTVGRDVFFNHGEFAPGTPSGQRLLRHELAHVAQQASVGDDLVQRDLKTFNEERIEPIPSIPAGGMPPSTMSTFHRSAEAPGVRAALSALVVAGKVKEVRSSGGGTSWFAAVHASGVTKAEIESAFASAGYAKAKELAEAVFNEHAEFLYTKDHLTTTTLFHTRSTLPKERISEEHSRALTEHEISEAKRVFGNSINYGEVTVNDGTLYSKATKATSNLAHVLGNVVNFPPGGSRNMNTMIHELVHVWQYQKFGWSYLTDALHAQFFGEGYAYTDPGKTAEQSLLDARAAGKALTDYNPEQQGDIIRDYYRRLNNGQPVMAWAPFATDLKR